MNENAMELVEMDDIEETMEYEPNYEDNEEIDSTDDNTNMDLGPIALVAAGFAVGALVVTQGPKVVKKIGGAAKHGLGKVKNILPGKKHHEIKSVQEDEVVEETVEEVTE